ncbi:MAG: hypothetical protein V1694_01325 [Candidatus Eisenbacteria bacterium]
MGALLSRIYRRFFWSSYDNIGRLVVLNALWFAMFPVVTYVWFRLIPLAGFARLVSTLLVALLTHSFASSGVFAAAARIVRREPTTIRQFFGDGRRYYARTLVLSVVFGFVFYLLFLSIRFYGRIEVGHGVLGFFLAGIQIWILAFCVLMQVYLWPILFTKDWELRRVIKWSAILVVLQPGLTVLLFLQVFGLFVLLCITGVGIAVLASSLVSLFLATTLREVLREMDAKWTPKKKPTSWKEIFAEQEEAEEDNRTLGDILRPWDS